LETSKAEFFKMIASLPASHIDKVFIYFSGKAFNGEGTNFPAIRFTNGETLLQPEFADFLRSLGLSLTIVGYDCGNYSQGNPTPALLHNIELPTCQLIKYNELLADNQKTRLSGMMNYTGELYFSAASPGQNAYSFVNLGSCFCNKLIDALHLCKSNWKQSLHFLSSDSFFKPYGMKPFHVGNLTRQ